MNAQPPLTVRPASVRQAEYALWAWTALTCLLGVYQSWETIPQIEAAMASDLQGLLTITPRALLIIFILGYGFLALTSAWIIIEIGRGKGWARTSVLLGFAGDVIWTGFSFEPGRLNILSDSVDVLFQLFALWGLYNARARLWFRESNASN